MMTELSKYIFYQFGGFVVDVFATRRMLYAVLVAAFLKFARLGFKKYR